MAQFSLRLKDLFILNWRSKVNLSSGLAFYRQIKTDFGISDYLVIVNNFKHRQAISKMRLSSHMLNIEKGRHYGIKREERKCELCLENDLEDEFHFIIKCKMFVELRKTYLPMYYIKHPSMFKFIQLLNVENKKVLHNLALFILKAIVIRNDMLTVMQ